MAKLGSGNGRLWILVVAGLGIAGAAASFGIPEAAAPGCGGPVEETDDSNLKLLRIDGGLTQVGANKRELIATPCFDYAAVQDDNPNSLARPCSRVDMARPADMTTVPSCTQPPTPPVSCVNSTGYPSCWYLRRDLSAARTSNSIYLQWEDAANEMTYVLQKWNGTAWVDTGTPNNANDTTMVYNDAGLTGAGLKLRVQARKDNCPSITSNEIQAIDLKRTYTADLKPLFEHRPSVTQIGAQCATCHRPTPPTGGPLIVDTVQSHAHCYAGVTGDRVCANDGYVTGGLDLSSCFKDPGNVEANHTGVWKRVNQAIGASGAGGVQWSTGRRVFNANYGVSGFDTPNVPTLSLAAGTGNFFVCNQSSGSNECNGSHSNRLTVKTFSASDLSSFPYWPKTVNPTSKTGQMPMRYLPSGIIASATNLPPAGTTYWSSEFPLTATEYDVVKTWIVDGARCE